MKVYIIGKITKNTEFILLNEINRENLLIILKLISKDLNYVSEELKEDIANLLKKVSEKYKIDKIGIPKLNINNMIRVVSRIINYEQNKAKKAETKLQNHIIQTQKIQPLI